MPWTQSAIEASLWAFFVSVQQWIANEVILTAFFKGTVITWFGFLFIKALYKTGSSYQGHVAITKVIVALFFSALGFAFLKTKSTEPFVPLNASGNGWTQSAKVRESGKYSSLQNSPSNGLAFYVQIHRGVNQMSQYMSGKIGEIFGNGNYNRSPFLVLQTLAKTASATIDDPALVSHLAWMNENCGDARTAPLVELNSSYSALYDLSKTECNDRYTIFKRDLSAWANNKWGTSGFNVTSIGASAVAAQFGADETALKNKLVSSALVNTLRGQLGADNDQNVHAAALFGDPRAQIADAGQKSTAVAVGAANFLSIGGILNLFLKPITGTDFAIADSRNDMAYMYNRIITFLPPIRGYAKGTLAIAFVFAAAAMCFGSLRFMISWFGMLCIFTMYEPISSLLYHSTLLFTNAKETIEAFAAIKADPLALGGAALIDDNLARIQAVYFGLQLALTIACAGAGLYVFMFSKNIGGGLADTIANRAISMTRFSSFVPSQQHNGRAQPRGGQPLKKS